MLCKRMMLWNVPPPVNIGVFPGDLSGRHQKEIKEVEGVSKQSDIKDVEGSDIVAGHACD